MERVEGKNTWIDNLGEVAYSAYEILKVKAVFAALVAAEAAVFVDRNSEYTLTVGGCYAATRDYECSKYIAILSLVMPYIMQFSENRQQAERQLAHCRQVITRCLKKR